MAKKKRDEFEIYAEEYGEDELDELMELREDFPELEEYLEDVLDLDDEDFYSSDHS
jgi:hypothetical protein